MNLKSLAEHLGLSQTTVSRALNGFPEVNDKTRQLVQAAAQQFNYQPNVRAKRLATGRSMAIGHLVSVSKGHEIVNPIFADFIAGASARYIESGYDLLLSLVPDENELSAYTDLAARDAVDGVIIHTPKEDDKRLERLNELNLPFVVHGRSTKSNEVYNWVDVNNERAFFRATEFLIDLGHRSIALVNGMADLDFAIQRTKGYERALSKHYIDPVNDYILYGEMTEPYGYCSTIALLDGLIPPTAIIASSIPVAIGVRRGIEERGLKMGRDISILSHDDDLCYFRDENDVPVFTSTRSSVREAGYKSANLLIKTIEDPTGQREGILLEADLIIGTSTKPAKS
ncbi:substrate-binding domain-containing protein [Paracoccaceae bacterium]|nr:substrate-binding domain-containing protein [Paracoccaceae bacterium]